MKTILVLSVLVIITTPYCYSASIEDTADALETPSDDKSKAHAECCADCGGATYTRWGRTACPSTQGTQLVYQGLAAGTWFDAQGGGANYVCLPKDIKFLSTKVPVAFTYLHGVEYQQPVISSVKQNDNAPCAVCRTAVRSSTLMIPGTTICPTSWTEEYEGYLMAELHSHKHNNEMVCVDKNAEAVPGTSANTNGALFYHITGVCNRGIPCPPMVAKRPVTCVVCTK